MPTQIERINPVLLKAIQLKPALVSQLKADEIFPSSVELDLHGTLAEVQSPFLEWLKERSVQPALMKETERELSQRPFLEALNCDVRDLMVKFIRTPSNLIGLPPVSRSLENVQKIRTHGWRPVVSTGGKHHEVNVTWLYNHGFLGPEGIDPEDILQGETEMPRAVFTTSDSKRVNRRRFAPIAIFNDSYEESVYSANSQILSFWIRKNLPIPPLSERIDFLIPVSDITEAVDQLIALQKYLPSCLSRLKAKFLSDLEMTLDL